MGLDMYLNKRIYIGAQYEHNKVTGTIDIKRGEQPIKINFDKVTYIEEQAGYWRKANQIHGWFVQNVQEGQDDCKDYDVSYSQLQELRALCIKVLEQKEKAGEILPPCQGFFFGNEEIDDWYFQNIQETIDIINALDPDGDYLYASSW